MDVLSTLDMMKRSNVSIWSFKEKKIENIFVKID